MKARLLLLPIAAAALAAGCATGPRVQTGADVTRFHLGQPIARGSIAIEPLRAEEGGSLQFTQIAAAVERELVRLGWTIAPPGGRSEQVAIVRLDQGARMAARPRSGVSVGVGGGTGGWGRSGVGVGVGASIPVGSGVGEIVVSELSVRIQRRSDGTALWEGRAQGEALAGAPLANPVAAAQMLAEALFRDFPGESGHTIRIR